ncbi:carboxypeptidase-like regulatory domain-containing protein [Luteimonas sp. BDR2-5]|uniref:carboxypeptidase-like regulatory domain-containing protein n=1 Tax=Proluteimonas luteida TaxID=2878685 RepID=UPI001E622A2E|nr:carboxypeptidase-like regulatory domain-containing protein [Luteimonas sp. BDR2-5]MCD9027119.1 carboxypeptidase-like regulatory domain-containing protein [Luteimonas sp. BDR2-5]
MHSILPPSSSAACRRACAVDSGRTPTMSNVNESTFFLAALLISGLTACGMSDGNSEAQVQSGYATGKVTDTQGRPIAGAKILLDNSVFYASYIDGTTRDDGSYRIKVQPGAWKADASFRKTYNGRTYVLELDPDNDDSFNEDGVVRDFTWKLEGRTPGNEYGYYGGFIQLSQAIGFYEDMEAIELTLTPHGPLIDGSPGKTLRLRVGDHYWVDRYQVEDVPIGRYMVTATLQGDDGPRPLKIQDWHAKGDFEQEFQLDFLPKSDSVLRISASIVIGE